MTFIYAVLSPVGPSVDGPLYTMVSNFFFQDLVERRKNRMAGTDTVLMVVIDQKRLDSAGSPLSNVSVLTLSLYGNNKRIIARQTTSAVRL